MNVYFEDSQSVEISLTPNHLFYCFSSSSLNNDLPIAPHWHYYIEILYVTIGSGQVIINGDAITMEKGDLLFTLPQDVHSIMTLNEKDFEYGVIKFDPILLYDSPFDAFFLKNIAPVVSPIPPKFKYYKVGSFSTELEENILSTLRTFNLKPYGYEFLVKSKLLAIYAAFINDLREKNIDLLNYSLIDVDYSSIITAFEYIHSNFAGPCNAEDAAKYCHLSYSYFSRQFKKVSGIPFTKYLNFIRITEAERLLLKKTYTVTEIGFKVGFTDTSYFIRQFKAFKKITPKQFLKLSAKSLA